MPLSSTSHRRTRSRVEANLSSPEPHMTDSSPIRHFSKKRKINDATRPQKISEEELQVNTVIACLSMPNHEVMVAHDHANDKNARNHRDGVQAYAKLSGLNWTFYVRELRTVLGRPPDTKPSGTAAVDSDVDIDLGPSKLVSRNHAVIEYDTTGYRSWVLNVTGRNGVKVDDELHKRGAIVYLKSGNMLEIAGVQMLFFLPDQEPTFSASLLKRAHEIHSSQDDGLQQTAAHSAQGSKNPGADLAHRSPASRSQRSGKLAGENGDSTKTVHSGKTRPVEAAPTTGSAPASGSTTSPAQEKPSAAYHRGLMLESTEDVDYSSDASKEIKPPFSYATLIAQAILSSEEEKLTLAQIYTWIQGKYAFYRHAATGWQNSIRHNLSLNKAFQKIPRQTNEPGKGMKWQIAEECREDFTRKAQRSTLKGTKSSQPSSPVSDTKGATTTGSGGHDSKVSLTSVSFQEAVESSSRSKKSAAKRSITPPPLVGSGRVTQKEAFTPDRGSRSGGQSARNVSSSVIQGKVKTEPENVKPPDDDPDEPPSPSQAQMLSSPFVQEYSSHALSTTAITPAPQRQHPLLAPPSTTQLPSSYMPTSSPAPFWKYLNMSTPARGEFSSPVKSPMLQSSSPPPVATNHPPESSSPTKERNPLAGTKRMIKNLAFSRTDDADADDIGDLEGVDLSKKNFQKIGTFHAHQAAHRIQVRDTFRGARFKR